MQSFAIRDQRHYTNIPFIRNNNLHFSDIHKCTFITDIKNNLDSFFKEIFRQLFV